MPALSNRMHRELVVPWSSAIMYLMVTPFSQIFIVIMLFHTVFKLFTINYAAKQVL